MWRFLLMGVAGVALAASANIAEQHAREVAALPGLVAFWSFGHPQAGVWHSAYDPETAVRSYPLYLRRIGDATRYTLETWPHTDIASQIRVDDSGPFGHALYCNQGYIYAESPRADFDGGPLDLSGEQPFTLVAWTKFSGIRHLVAGIWDEGGWDKYRGRRQFALFGGLFGRNGITAHISASGAASYPQSTMDGSQYARERALDGANFTNDQWVCMAMTFDPTAQTVTAWLNGVATPLVLGDSVENDVFDNDNQQQANPYQFQWPLYSPRRFILKYNGYHVQGDVITTSLLVWQDEAWTTVGSEITYPIPEGAPFTLGRALGLGTEPLDHGSQLYIDGVAVFNRMLAASELQAIAFVD